MYLIILFLVFYASVVFPQTEHILITEECKIPNFASSNEDTKRNFPKQSYTNCSNSDPLTFTQVINNTAFLHISEENEIFHKSEKPITCCYSYVTRNGSEEEPDVGISVSNCTPFNSTTELESDTVMVNCERDSVVIYENVHNPITITEEVQEKLNNSEANTNDFPMSVLIVVIDSVSRLNFKRTMPETRKFLMRNGFIDFIAYNKVDDNTFPNCMALLSGLNLRQAYSMCNPFEVGKLDECPIIWYNYRNLGYVTAYAEDWADISTFNYLKKGFQNPPTDYYFKPYVEAAEMLNRTMKDSMPYCAGPETEGERILNVAKDFADTFKHKPSFGIFWMNSFSHNYINSPSGMDKKVANFFHDLHSKQILNESLVIVLSDHGIRFGELRNTIQGWFEERLPFNYISVPSWFQKKFPEKYQNFKENARKLISTYDVYMTLQDVLKMSVDSYNVSSSLACPRCQSLFSNITKDRSCRDAGIPEAWCTCVGKFSTNDSRITEEVNNTAIRLALNEMKRWKFRESFSISHTKILNSAVNLNRLRKSYLLLIFQTDSGAVYQAFFRIRGDPIQFVRVIKVMKLQPAKLNIEENKT